MTPRQSGEPYRNRAHAEGRLKLFLIVRFGLETNDKAMQVYRQMVADQNWTARRFSQVRLLLEALVGP